MRMVCGVGVLGVLVTVFCSCGGDDEGAAAPGPGGAPGGGAGGSTQAAGGQAGGAPGGGQAGGQAGGGQGGAGQGGGAGGCASPSAGDVLAAGQSAPGGLATDGGHVYWRYAPSAEGAADGGVRRVPVEGGCTEEVVTGLGGPAALTVAKGEVFVVDAKAGVIVRAPSGGGAATVLYPVADTVYELVADADALYFSLAKQGAVVRAPLDGSGLQTLASGQKHPLGLAVDATHVYFASDGDEGAGFSNGSFSRVAKAAGSAVEVLASPVTGGQDVAASGSVVFFLQFGAPGPMPSGALWKLDLPGSTPTKILSPTGPGGQIETDGATAYVSGYVPKMGGGIYRVTGGGEATMLVPSDPPPPFALGASHVFYAAAGEIRRAAR